jgi:rRNA maturation RNase YbeY
MTDAPPHSGFFPSQAPIQFHVEDTETELPDASLMASWLKEVIVREDCDLHHVNFIFCTDEYLHQLNVQYLQHDTLTDIITFPYQDPPAVEGDVFISVDRVEENAGTYEVSFFQELQRVMAHGILHLCGYSDKTAEEKAVMTRKENEALVLLEQMRR